MSTIRIQKLISQAGITSRRNAERLIRQGRISINGKTALLGEKANPSKDNIYIDGTLISLKMIHKVILINKPIGVISTCRDPQGRRTVLDLIPLRLRKGMYPIGRLDLNSRGALLLTNHGELALRLTHPKFRHTKTYEVLVKGIPSEKILNFWREGIIMEGARTLKAKVKIIKTKKENALLQIILKEGRNRQIRKVGDMLGHPVIDLNRTAINNLTITKLKEGDWKLLKKSQWEYILDKN